MLCVKKKNINNLKIIGNQNNKIILKLKLMNHIIYIDLCKYSYL